MKLNFQKLDIEIPVEIPVNFMISTGTGIPANRLILTGTGILPGSRSILAQRHSRSASSRYEEEEDGQWGQNRGCVRASGDKLGLCDR